MTECIDLTEDVVIDLTDVEHDEFRAAIDELVERWRAESGLLVRIAS